jgi:hypothetical protein
MIMRILQSNFSLYSGEKTLEKLELLGVGKLVEKPQMSIFNLQPL